MTTTSERELARGGRLGCLPGVDGLRAVAVSAVFLFHAEVVPGGFLGVEVFFVISGFLVVVATVAPQPSSGTQRRPTAPGASTT